MFGRFFGKSKPKQATGLPPLSTSISGSILNVVGAKSIPSMPGAAQKAFQLATDPNAEARDFMEVIESDEALSARIIKIANSVFFDRGQKSTTIEASVTVIGINELRCILNANALTDIFPSKHPYRSVLWANDIATGLIARNLAQRLMPAKAEIAFLGGLMHDIGKLLLLQRSTDEYGRVLKIVETEGISFSDAEERRFPFTHTEVGQLIAERWNFTPEITTIIRDHHRPWDSSDAQSREVSLTSLVKSADIFAHALGLGHPKGFTKVKSNAQNQLEEVWSVLKIPADERKSMLEHFEKTYALEYDLYTSKGGQE